MSVNVQLPKFEGPLALLIYLIRKDEMDIFDINIHEITQQYLDYVKLIKELDLETAGEFVAMAATLIQIKSRMLLPQYNEEGEIVETEDPRKELVQKILEYQKFQEASKLLYERALLGRDVFARGIRENLFSEEEDIVTEENALYGLISSYRRLVKNFKKKIHKVSEKTQSIASRILEFKDQLIIGKKMTMMELVTATEDRMRQVLITFLSLLELGKMGLISLYQSETYADIWLEAKKPIETDVISRVEEYDSIHSEEIANKMMATVDPIQDNEENKEMESPQVQIENESNSASVKEDFILKDAEDAILIDSALNSEKSEGDLNNLDFSEFTKSIQQDSFGLPDEMASDDEIFQAEQALVEKNEPEILINDLEQTQKEDLDV